MVSEGINDFARWLVKFDANTLRLWALALLIAFWGVVGWLGYHALGTLGVMYQ
jgi:hypothetical protein